MESNKKHQTLIEIESKVNAMLTNMTNAMWARGKKLTYKIEWRKGEGTISNGINESNNYHIFKLYVVDKTETIVGQNVDLYVNFYDTSGKFSVNRILEVAYNEFLFNGIQSLINISYGEFKLNKHRTYVEAENIKMDNKIEQLQQADIVKPKLFVP